jgi:hypothetical protein
MPMPCSRSGCPNTRATTGVIIGEFSAKFPPYRFGFVGRQAQKKKSFKQHPNRNPQFENIPALRNEHEITWTILVALIGALLR